MYPDFAAGVDVHLNFAHLECTQFYSKAGSPEGAETSASHLVCKGVTLCNCGATAHTFSDI